MNHCLLKMYGTLKINVNHSKTEPSRNRGCSSRPDGGCSVPDHSGRHQSQVTLWHYDEADRLTHRTVPCMMKRPNAGSTTNGAG